MIFLVKYEKGTNGRILSFFIFYLYIRITFIFILPFVNIKPPSQRSGEEFPIPVWKPKLLKERFFSVKGQKKAAS